MKTKKLFINLLSLTIIFTPFLVFAEPGLVPKCGIFSGGTIDNVCDLEELMQLINNVINFLLFTIATPLAALIIIYAGILYIFDGGSSKKIETAKSILKNVVIGYVIALAAWLIVKVIITTLGFEGGQEYINY